MLGEHLVSRLPQLVFSGVLEMIKADLNELNTCRVKVVVYIMTPADCSLVMLGHIENGARGYTVMYDVEGKARV